MMTEPIRIAHVIGKVCRGGVESAVFNYYRHIDRTKYQFDFIVDDDSPYELPEDILALGCRVYKIPSYVHLRAYIKSLVTIFRDEQYRMVQSHMNALSVFTLYAAKKAGVPVRIALSQSTASPGEGKRTLLKNILRRFSRVYPTHFAACSLYAGEWLFGKKACADGLVFLMRNTTETDIFKYDPDVRSKMRSALGIDGKFVVGHVGRFMYQKNHDFLIDLFAEVRANREDAILLLVGDGELQSMIEKKVFDKGLSESVIFLGSRTDVCDIMNAMDVFVLPSHYEGLSVVAVEAQSAGLPCVLSDTMTAETVMSEYAVQLSLKASLSDWRNAVLKRNGADRASIAEASNVAVRAKGYDTQDATRVLQEYYDTALGKDDANIVR
jgi:glycosyltransferase EpsF